MKDKIIAIIPARYSSSRFPGKPLIDIVGKPMIERVYDCAKKSELLDDIFVATDDERIASCVKGFGGKFVMTKKDHPSGSDRLAEASVKLGLSDSDIIVNIQGDQPVFPTDLINQLVNPLINNDTSVMSTLAVKIVRMYEISDPNYVKVVFDSDFNALYFSRASIPFDRDDIQNADYYRHIGVYAYRKDFLLKYVKMPESRLEKIEKLEQLRVLENGYKIKLGITEYESMEVDTPKGLKAVESYIRQNNL